MNFEQSPEFSKEVKRLAKKWRSLPSDLKDAELQIASLYIEREDIALAQYRSEFFATNRATIIHTTGEIEVVKMRLDVASLKTNSKVRIVFVAIKTETTICFIELYAKNEKDREDTKRIKKYLP